MEGNLSSSHCYQFDGSASKRDAQSLERELQVWRRAPEPKPASFSLMSLCKCRVGNKQEELERCSLQGCDLTGLVETCQDGSCHWSAGIGGCRLFRKCRRWKWGRTVSNQVECMELCLGIDEKLTKSLWDRIKGRAGTGYFSALVFTDRCSTPIVWAAKGKEWLGKLRTTCCGRWVWEHLRKLQGHKSMEPDEMCLWVLKELVDDMTKPVSIKFDKLCQCHEGPTDWKKGNIPPIEKRRHGEL